MAGNARSRDLVGDTGGRSGLIPQLLPFFCPGSRLKLRKENPGAPGEASVTNLLDLTLRFVNVQGCSHGEGTFYGELPINFRLCP